MRQLVFVSLFVIPFCKAVDDGVNSSWDQAVGPIIAVFPNFQNIRTLNLAGGSITDLPENPNLPNLENLYLNRNKIHDVDLIEFKQFLNYLPKLSNLDLRNNLLTKKNADELIKIAAEIEAETGQYINIITDEIGDQHLPKGSNIKRAD